MLIRVFRARPRPGMEDEFAHLVESVSIPFVDSQPGLIARHAGRGIGQSKDEVVMITIWENLEAMKTMTGEGWENVVIPDPREAERIESCTVDHYETMAEVPT